MPDPILSNGTDEAVLSRRLDAVHAVFEALARRPDLHEGYVLKGGLALQLVYGSPRRSTDLDLNAVRTSANAITEETGRILLDFCRSLDEALAEVAPTRGFERLSTANITLSKEIPTILGGIGFTTIGGESGSVPMQLTLSEIICETSVRHSQGIPVHVASLEDIMAEKLKALLQQVSRDKVRSTDVFDLWYFTSRSAERLRAEDVTPILVEKRKQWPEMPALTKGQYRLDGVVDHAKAEYEKIRELVNGEFAPFDEAYEAVLDFVDRLQLPD